MHKHVEAWFGERRKVNRENRFGPEQEGRGKRESTGTSPQQRVTESIGKLKVRFTKRAGPRNKMLLELAKEANSAVRGSPQSSGKKNTENVDQKDHRKTECYSHLRRETEGNVVLYMEGSTFPG